MSEPEKRADDSFNFLQRELIGVLSQVYLSVLRVNLQENTVYVLYSVDQPDTHMRHFGWTEFLAHYCAFISEHARPRAARDFSAANLLAEYQAGRASLSRDFSYTARGALHWLTMTAHLRSSQDGSPCAYVLVQKTSEEHLLKSIIELYVYSNCDFFIYLDAKSNSYTMFSGKPSGAPLPPAQCDDYTAEMTRYMEAYVVPEDREFAIREMQLDRVLEQLEHHEVHTFFCGVSDPVLGYTHKRLDFRYYDRASQMILLSRTDVTAMYLAEQEHHQALQHALGLAQTDSLTGLLNRQGLVEMVTQALSKSSANAALLFIDLDNFKTVNDSLGHQAGDNLLRQAAAVLRQETRASDLVGRVGGDEFVVFLSHAKSRKSIISCAQRICTAINNLSYHKDFALPVSCSIGVAVAPDDGRDYESLAKAADRLTYQAKAEGKNRFSI